VEVARDAAAHEQETNALEWKGSLDLTSKRGLTKIVKAVLSFANRQPDEASRLTSRERSGAPPECRPPSTATSCAGGYARPRSAMETQLRPA
jgi:hypothetical protein